MTPLHSDFKRSEYVVECTWVDDAVKDSNGDHACNHVGVESDTPPFEQYHKKNRHANRPCNGTILSAVNKVMEPIDACRLCLSDLHNHSCL